MLNQDILRRVEHAGAVDRIRNYQAGTLNQLLEPSRLARLIEAEADARKANLHANRPLYRS